MGQMRTQIRKLNLARVDIAQRNDPTKRQTYAESMKADGVPDAGAARQRI